MFRVSSHTDVFPPNAGNRRFLVVLSRTTSQKDARRQAARPQWRAAQRCLCSRFPSACNVDWLLRSILRLAEPSSLVYATSSEKSNEKPAWLGMLIAVMVPGGVMAAWIPEGTSSKP